MFCREPMTFNHFAFGWPDEYEESDIKSRIGEIDSALLIAQAKYEGLCVAAKHAREEYAHRVLVNMGIRTGSTCFIKLVEGDEKVIYEGCSYGKINLRHFTKKGKPCKNTLEYDYTDTQYIVKDAKDL